MTNPFADANEQAQRAAQTSQTALGTVQSVAPEGHAVLVRPDSADEGSDPVTAFVVEQYAGDSSLPSQGDRVAIQRLTNDTALMLGVVYGDKGDVPNTTSRTLADAGGSQQVFNGTVSRSSWDYTESYFNNSLGDVSAGRTVLGSYLYLMGDNGTFYRVNTSDWSTEQLSDHPLGYTGVGLCNDGGNIVYIVGGDTSQDKVYEYDVTTDTFTSIGAFAEAEDIGGTVQIGGNIFYTDQFDDEIVELDPSAGSEVASNSVPNGLARLNERNGDIILSYTSLWEYDVSNGTTTLLDDSRRLYSGGSYNAADDTFHFNNVASTGNGILYSVYETYDFGSDSFTTNEVMSVPHESGAGYYRSSDGTYVAFAGTVGYPQSFEEYLGQSDQSVVDNQTGLYTVYSSSPNMDLINLNTGSDGSTLFFKADDELVTTSVGDLELFRV
jgi:hypothetical protein